MNRVSKSEVIAKLQRDILCWEGFKPAKAIGAGLIGLGPVEAAFPNQIFPVGAVHEFICATQEDAAATGGFISGLLKTLMKNGSGCLWVSKSRKLFPPGLSLYGISPDRILFVDVNSEKDILWATEEALKCQGMAAVICELGEVSFNQSRRLQLVCERSKVTSFIIRSDPQKITQTACVARWLVTSIASQTKGDLPGVGFPRWRAELLKVRNGNPASCEVEWSKGKFKVFQQQDAVEASVKRKYA